MDRDRFYENFMETASPAPVDPVETEDMSSKETFTRAEVEELINQKIEEMKGGFYNGNEETGGSTEGTEGNDENGGNESE